MVDKAPRCFLCRDPLNPRGDQGSVELNPRGGGHEGFHMGKVCSDCESDLAEKMKKTTGGNV
jgi:hypothetical protein